MRIYRLAAAKDKIKRFGITDPFISFFIYTYESSIDWSKVKTENAEEEINRQIQRLTDGLYSKIDPKSDNNNYIKKINIKDELKRGWNKPEIKQCKDVYLERGREAATQLRLRQLNDAKEKEFKKWWNWGFGEHNPPAFTYILLKMAFDLSKKTDKDPTIKKNDQVIENLYKTIKAQQVSSFNIEEAYSKDLNKINATDMEPEPTDPDPNNGWLRIKSKSNDPENFEENVQKLIDFSTPNGWCTGYGQAEPYLSNGDFWLYLKSRKAVAAIRFSGDTITEIQGRRNQPAFDHFEQILSLIKRKGFSTNGSHYNLLKGAEQTNKLFEENKGLIYSFDLYVQLTQANRKKFPPDTLAKLIHHAAENEVTAYSVAQFYDFDITKISKEIIQKITERKTSNETYNSRSETWVWPPWKWAQSVRFNASKMPPEVIDCIANNNFTSLEFAKQVGYDKNAIPESIINTISQSSAYSFSYAKEALFEIDSIPESIIGSIAKDEKLFIDFAVKSNLDIKNLEEKMLPTILKSPELCALTAKNYDYNIDKIPENIWAGMTSTLAGCLKFAEGIAFDINRLPKEIISKIISFRDGSLEYAEKTGWSQKSIPQEIINKIAGKSDDCLTFASGVNYDMSKVPETLNNTLSKDTSKVITICGILNYDENKIPPQFIETMAANPMFSATFAKNPNYNVNKLPKSIIESIASTSQSSIRFAELRDFNTGDIPLVVIESISKDAEFSMQFAQNKIKKWQGLKQVNKKDFIAEKEIPKSIINAISTNPMSAYIFSQDLDFNIMQIPESIRKGVGNDPSTAIDFAIGVNYNYAKMTPNVIDAIATNAKASSKFMSGVRYDKNRIDPRMIESVTKAYLGGISGYEIKAAFKNYLVVSNFNLSGLNEYLINNITTGILTDPSLCLGFVKSVNAIPSKIPSNIMQAIIADPFSSSNYAEIAHYDNKIPPEIITSISRYPSYAFAFVKGCKFNFYNIPGEIMKGVSQDPNLFAILKQKYAEFKALEKTRNTMGTEPQKTKNVPPVKNPNQKIETKPEIKITKIQKDNMRKSSSVKIIKLAENKIPDAETLALCVLTLKVYLKDNENAPEEYKNLIEKLPAPRKIRQEFSIKECEVLYETVEYLWKKITGQRIIPEENIQKAPEKMQGNYWLLNNGILLKGTNHFDIIKRNSVLFCSLLGIGGMTLQEYISGDPNKLIWWIIRNGGVRLFITKDKRFYCQMNPTIYGKWGRKKIQKYDFKKKVVKVIDLNAPYEGWKSGITVVL